MNPRLLDADVQIEIGKTMDRSWCLALVEALADPALPFDQRRPLERTLADLDDPRFVEPLLAILNDHKQATPILESAVNVLSECGVLASWSACIFGQPDVASNWIGSGNTHLHRLGFSLGNRADRQAIDEYISEVFDPPEVGESERITSMRACLPAAVASMAFGFEEPEYQARKVSLLDHADPEVRAAAARTLLWDEPNLAEYPLIGATRDADPDVVIDALDVLRYYPTLAVRQVLVTATSEAATLQQRQMADQSLASIDEDLHRELDTLVDHPDQLPATKAWFGEARRVLGVGVSVDLDATTSSKLGVSQPDALVLDAAVALSQSNTSKPETEWNQALVESLRDPDGLWAPKLRWLENLQPEQIPSTDVATFCISIAHHDDPNVRYRATRILAGCDCVDLLLHLLEDPVGGVRKGASYALHDVSPSQLVADTVLAPVLSGELGGTRASESVRTWARHAFALDAETAGVHALALAEDRRESVRHAAIKQVVAFGVPGGKSLIKLLRADPLVTWAVHSTLITSRHLLGISDRSALSALDRFLDADSLWLQLALATFRA
jgi:HEAT repeat protein